MNYLKAILLLCFTFSFTSLQAQLTIQGTITDAKTGKTVPGANVFLSNTTIGASTNAQGKYRIEKIPSGVYILVFSFVGYQTRTFQIKIENASSSKTIDMQLKPKVLEINEVEIVSSNKEWKKNFEIFRKEFIGTSSFASKTIIANKEILDFKNENSGELLAYSDEPLVINNNALGYTIYIDLNEFRWSKGGNRGFYRVYPRFEKMKPQNENQRKTWEKNREKAYEGSFRHFMKSLYQGAVNLNNFKILNPAKLVSLSKEETKFELFGKPTASEQLVEILKGFRIYQELHIKYGVGNDPFRTYRSVLFPNTANEIFFADNNGNLLNPNSLELSGSWANNRLGDQLPFNYPEN